MEANHVIPALRSPKSAKQLLDMYFLDVRSALLETAAAFDRIERAAGGAEIFKDPRFNSLKEACDIIKNGKVNRAEQFLTLFSDPK
jgi:hypothetical protein